MKQYSAVVFDWDGTLMDSTHTIVTAIQSACADLDLPIPEAGNASWVIGLSLESALYHVAPTLTAEQLPHFVDRYKFHFLNRDPDIKFFDGVLDLLAGLRQNGIMLGVATGKSRAGLDRVLRAQGLADFFHLTRCADESFGKPHPAMLLQIMDELGMGPEHCIMVGDTTHDVLMARNAGIDSLAVTYGAHDRATLLGSEPTSLVSSIKEAGKWLKSRVGAPADKSALA